MLDNNNKNIRTLSTYISLLGMKSKSTQKLFQSTINNIATFGKINIHDTSKLNENDIYDLLQEWIMWNNARGITTSSIMCYFNNFRSYLWYNGIKLDWRDIRYNLRFPKTLYENQSPITPNSIKKILCASELEFRFQLLSLISSGMRVRELGQIKSAYLDLSKPNIMVKIPAQITKTGQSRITFFSKQVSDMIRYRLEKNQKSNDHLFCGQRTPSQSVNLILKRFAVARKKSNMLDKYTHCKQNRYMIHVHSLRSYFITKVNRIQFGIGHILAGHNFYMKSYNRYTHDELLSLYNKAEKDLTFKHKNLTYLSIR